MGSLVTEEAFRFRYVRPGVPAIAGMEITIYGTAVLQMLIIWQKFAAQQRKKLIQAGPRTHRDVVDSIDRLRLLNSCGKKVGLRVICHVAEITSCFAVAT